MGGLKFLPQLLQLLLIIECSFDVVLGYFFVLVFLVGVPDDFLLVVSALLFLLGNSIAQLVDLFDEPILLLLLLLVFLLESALQVFLLSECNHGYLVQMFSSR